MFVSSGSDCTFPPPVLEDALSSAAEKEILLPWGVGIVGHVANTKEIINIKDAYQVGLNSIRRILLTHPSPIFAWEAKEADREGKSFLGALVCLFGWRRTWTEQETPSLS